MMSSLLSAMSKSFIRWVPAILSLDGAACLETWKLKMNSESWTWDVNFNRELGMMNKKRERETWWPLSTFVVLRGPGWCCKTRVQGKAVYAACHHGWPVCQLVFCTWPYCESSLARRWVPRHIQLSVSTYTREELKAYKSLDGYNFLIQGWVNNVQIISLGGITQVSFITSLQLSNIPKG